MIEKLRREIRSDVMELHERRVESSRHYFLKGRIDGNKETLARLEQIQGK